METRMMRLSLILSVAVLTAVPALAQHPGNSRYGNGMRMPLSPVPPSGEPVAPFMEGWFRNEDGTFTFSFGFFNLNTEQILDIPIGPDNFIEPAEFNGRQPTHFPSGRFRRDRGVFEVTVPASYEDGQQRVTWTITANDVTYSIPARVGYEALQLSYDAKAMGSVAPMVSFSASGQEGQHISGIRSEPLTATVGSPLELNLWAREVSVRDPNYERNANVNPAVTWFKYQGPAADVVFDPKRLALDEKEGQTTTTATFTEPGEYVLRARVDNWGANDSSGADQCCWTNAYVPVTVTAGPPDRN